MGSTSQDWLLCHEVPDTAVARNKGGSLGVRKVKGLNGCLDIGYPRRGAVLGFHLSESGSSVLGKGLEHLDWCRRTGLKVGTMCCSMTVHQDEHQVCRK
jgi:hypothetical protein